MPHKPKSTKLASLATIVITAAFTGCAAPPPAALPPAPSLDDVDLLTRDAGTPAYEQWYVHSIGSHKLGHRWYREFRQDAAQPRTLRTAVDELAIPRFGSVAHWTLRTATLADERDGRIEQLEYVVEPLSGGAPRRMAGKTMQNRLFLQSIKNDRKSSLQQPWQVANAAFFAVEQSLQRQPMQPGERRVVTSWPALVDQTQSIVLVATDWESPSSHQSPARVLRIDGWTTRNDAGNRGATANGPAATITVPSRPPDTTYWATEKGRLQKIFRAFLNQTTTASTKQAALAPNESLKFDIALQLAIPVEGLPKEDGALEMAHAANPSTRLARFQVDLPGGDAGAVFSPCGYQRVAKRADDAVEIVVGMPTLTAHQQQLAELYPDLSITDSIHFNPPGTEYVAANRWIDCDHPAIQAFAQRMEHQDSIEAFCEAATKRVHDLLNKDFLNGSLQTASQALLAKSGDCTEHAMLLAAVLRAHQIPAQVATGMILDPKSASFQFHMWTEAWNGSSWLPFDATSNQQVPNALRLRVDGNSLSDSENSTNGAAANSSDWAIVAPVLALPRQITITFLK